MPKRAWWMFCVVCAVFAAGFIVPTGYMKNNGASCKTRWSRWLAVGLTPRLHRLPMQGLHLRYHFLRFWHTSPVLRLQPPGRAAHTSSPPLGHVTSRINCSTVTTRTPNIRWLNTLA